MRAELFIGVLFLVGEAGNSPHVAPGGGLVLPGLGSVATTFSGPARGFGVAPPSPPGGEWDVVVRGTTVVGISRDLNITVRRTYTLPPPANAGRFSRVLVTDEFSVGCRDTPCSGSPVGIFINTTLLTDESSGRVAMIPGAFYGQWRTDLETNLVRGTNGNPSVLVSLRNGAAAVGLMPFDDALRAHAYITRSPGGGRVSVTDPYLALPPGDHTYVSSWGVYYCVECSSGTGTNKPASTDAPTQRYFDFINTVRGHLGVNSIKILGGGTMGALRTVNFGEADGWTDSTTWDADTVEAYYRYQGLYYAGSDIPRLPHEWPSTNCTRYQRNYCYGSCYAEGFESAASAQYNARVTRVSHGRVVIYMHPFLSTEPGARQRYPLATRIELQGGSGAQLCYGECIYCCMWFGTVENAYGKELLKYVDRALGTDGFGGVYMDESTYSTSPLNFNPLVWDNRTAILDLHDFSVTAHASDTTLLFAPLKLQIYDKVLSHSPSSRMANSAPVAGSVVTAGAAAAAAGRKAVVNFVETGSVAERMRWAQLYTPIGLAKQPVVPGHSRDINPRYQNVTGEPVSNLRAALDFGCITFMYDRRMPNVTGWRTRSNVFQHIAPITPVQLGFGYIVGETRVITKVSGTFDPLLGSSKRCVRYFDEAGYQTSVETRPATPPRPVTVATRGFVVITSVEGPVEACA